MRFFPRTTTACLTLATLMMLGGCSDKAADDAAANPVALVTLGQAETGRIDQTVPVYGVIDSGADGTSVLVAPSEAIVASVDAPVGSAVTAGQAVIHLVPSPATRQDTVRIMADATSADAAYARAKRLRADNLVSDADVESAAATARAADAALSAAQTRNAGLILKSPKDGYVVAVTQNPGDMVAAGTSLATISSTGHLRALFGVDPALAQKVRIGAQIHITPESGPAFEASVVSVSPVVDPATHLAPVVASIPADTGLGSGQALSGELPVSTTSEALTIPYSALLDDGGQPYVFVVKDGVAHRADVTTGAQSGQRIAILKGLHSGDQVVTAGGTALEDGMKVRLK
ncbi:efflux RND transporter periplasmic adaptor subunit [Asticcacaulis sp. EMRT-3]|uniref:efflux RND transporter periplasmic adaptor subunit n=1 Tax=Asticcacaulis sp. EMRT-3 TaxID=3040349 RepID=UPI0024AEA54A|nr:efflux RND transporter periplasmic adaptor subunit [Asticcacaulis sp. EMRT-3]MDI7775774.1 efflux RND transporter periplasmic adaptor subunit [Asticcacaulis sp. EMRT-3]